MHLGDSGDHRVFVKGVGLTMHQLSPAAKSRAIETEDVEGVAHLIQPTFDFIGFGWILFTGAFDPGLDFADGHAGEVEIGILNALQPGQHGAMGARPAQFGHHVGVEQVGHGLTAPRRAGGGQRLEVAPGSRCAPRGTATTP